MIYLYGAGGHAKVVLEILEQQRKAISGLLDINPHAKKILDYPVFLPERDTYSNAEAKIIICVGNNATRKMLAEELSVNFETAIHPLANISIRSSIGCGSVVMASVNINSCSIIGRHVILNTSCSVDHDCIIEDFVHLAPNTAIAGNVKIGEGTHIGIGACVIQGIKIGKWAIIGAGAVIIADVPDYAVVVGNPGKIIKYNQPSS